MASSIKEFAQSKLPLSFILEATNNFSNKNIIGKGEFGNVYKMQIDTDVDTKCSARRFNRKGRLRDDAFLTEISVLSRLQGNINVVCMFGFCEEEGEKIIVYEHYKKGSLEYYISKPTRLKWPERLRIANNLASAIAWIHDTRGRSYYVIHRNINSYTILLNDSWTPALSGFEYCIEGPVSRSNQVFRCKAIGTKGYMDPAIEKNDGRKANPENGLLAPLAKLNFEKGTLQNIIHPKLLNQMGPRSLKLFSEAAYSCLEDDPERRPDPLNLLNQLKLAETVNELQSLVNSLVILD
ncbi:receptor-like protein kinase ANXUR2 [Rutidosis leptorrhynchoides]|uniref:receptor-like protein kinase ANXUR2 n=1 Tax=Rutidosis leptorrhynchoides TaxID=125765 RepID=UPI003A9A552E